MGILRKHNDIRLKLDFEDHPIMDVHRRMSEEELTSIFDSIKLKFFGRKK